MSSFHEVRFPEDVSWGSSGGPMFKTQVFESFRGYEQRNVDWSQPLMQFNVAYGIKTDVQMLSVLRFFNARRGRAFGFRYKNWANYRIQNAPIATGDGSSTRLPLWKFYGFPGARQYKRLRKIVRGSVTGVGIAAVGSLVEGEDYHINYDEGEIAFNDPIGYAVPIYASNLEFDEPVRFDEDNIQAVIDGYNNQSLTDFSLIGVKSGFTTGSVFAPDEDASGNDTFYENVRLILNFDDVSTLTTTVDQSELALPVTFNGAATLTTDAFQHGSGSLELGTAGYLSLSGTPFDLSTTPFSIEVFATRPSDGEAEQTIIAKWDEGASDRCWTLRYKSATQLLQFVISTDGSDETVILNYPWADAESGAFDYITVDRTSAGWYLLRINGLLVQRVRNNTTMNDASTDLVIGSYASPDTGQGAFQGNIDSVRFTVGRCRNPAFDNTEIPSVYPA